MGRVPAHQPLVGNGGSRPWSVPLVDPHCKGRQQPLRPLQRFVPRHVCVGLSGAFSPLGHYCQWVVRRLERHVSTFLHPLAPPALPGFIATMGALTPGRPALQLYEPELRLGYRPGLPASRAWSSEPSVSNHLTAPIVALTPNPSARWASRLGRVRVSSFASRLTGQPGRIEFVSLRTTRSPPVALHLASRRRSYDQLQAGVGVPEEDLHLPGQTRLQAHWHGHLARGIADTGWKPVPLPIPRAARTTNRRTRLNCTLQSNHQVPRPTTLLSDGLQPE